MYKYVVILLTFIYSCACTQTQTLDTRPREEMINEKIDTLPSINKQITNLHLVEDGIYRSGRLNPYTDMKILTEVYKIKTIISLETYWLDSKLLKAEISESQKYGINFIHIPMLPIGHLDKQKMLKAASLLWENKKSVLIHCYRGSERTGIVVGAYRRIYDKWSYKDTVTEMDDKGFNKLFNEWKDNLIQLGPN